MKALVFSDLHGSLSSVNFLAQKMSEVQPDFLFLLGDLLYQGPRNPVPGDYNSSGVADVLNKFSDCTVAVRGNCDSEVDAMLITTPLASPFSWCVVDGVRFFLTHGHIFYPGGDTPLRKGDCMISGHTHVPTAEESDGIFYCNPGSMTLPKNGHPPTFGFIENKKFSVLTKEGDIHLSVSLN